jgi:hypothetical protein
MEVKSYLDPTLFVFIFFALNPIGQVVSSAEEVLLKKVQVDPLQDALWVGDLLLTAFGGFGASCR